MPYLIAQEGPLKGLVLPLDEGEEWVLGRDADEADLLIEDTTASRKHLRITKTGGQFFVKNLSRTNPTTINDDPIQANVPLKEGDKIRIGDNLFIFSEENAAPSVEAPPTKGKQSGGYDDIFGDLEEPELPPEPEPLETPTAQSRLTVEEEPAKSAYDTIFEDDLEPELPFNLLSETPLILKVIGGPNAGAEIGLEKGRSYLLGKDSNTCDIVFQDLSVSRNHARLNVSSDGILELEDLGSKNSTIINGSPLLEKRIVTPQDLIALGTTVFLIIDREAVQETIFSPALPAYEAMRTAEKGAALEEEALPSEPATSEEPYDWKQEKIPTKYLLIGGSIAAIFLIAFLSFFSLFKSEPIEIVHKTPHESLKDALSEYPGVHYAFNPASGKLFLAGHVLTGVQYQEMLFALEQVHGVAELENNVVVDEGVSRSMNDVLASHAGWQGVTIVAPQPGRFIAHGFVKTSNEATQVDEYLVSNFPYVDLLQNQIVVEEILLVQIEALLRSAGFGAVLVQSANGALVLSGSYPDTKEKQLHELLDQLNKVQGVTSVRNYAVALSPMQSRVDISTQYAVSGASLHDQKGYNVIINGHIYTLGEQMDGMEITSIGNNQILLEKDGVKYKINYTR